jgi:hypothetical protein
MVPADSSDAADAVAVASLLGQRGKGPLGLAVPPHPRDGMPPATLHVLQRTVVGIVTALDHISEVLVLRLYDLIGRRAAMRDIAWSTHFFASHCSHDTRILSSEGSTVEHRPAHPTLVPKS